MIPKLIFIIPYRDREEHKLFFTTYMKFIMEDYPSSDYNIFFVHQKDNRPFNRGAMKNIGFIAIKEKYPDDYKDITLVFHDVDTLPYNKNLLKYNTVHGTIKHFYGFTYALGGIFSIKGSDFEKINGFPNFWAWGFEDNLIQERALNHRLIIDRSNFFKIGDKKILQFMDGLRRLISKDETHKFLQKIDDGLKTIKDLKYNFNNEYIDVLEFNTLYNHDEISYDTHDIRNKNTVKLNNNKQISMKNFFN
jgi:hypothetical protein